MKSVSDVSGRHMATWSTAVAYKLTLRVCCKIHAFWVGLVVMIYNYQSWSYTHSHKAKHMHTKATMPRPTSQTSPWWPIRLYKLAARAPPSCTMQDIVIAIYTDLSFFGIFFGIPYFSFLHASAMLKHVLAIGWTSVRPSVRPSVCLSVCHTSLVYCAETAQPISSTCLHCHESSFLRS